MSKLMRNSVRLAVLAVPLLATCQIALAVDYEKNGMPCVAELCVGDGLAELAKVQWERSRNIFSSPQKPLYTSTRKIDAEDLGLLKKTYRGDVGPAAPFLQDKKFDAGVLPALARVTAACSPNHLTGTYLSPNGHPTDVKISLTSVQGPPDVQRWTVVSITRTYPRDVSEQQRKEVEDQLISRYKQFGAGGGGPKIAPGVARYAPTYGLFGFQLVMFQGGGGEIERLKLHPLCGGAASIKID